MSIALLKNCRDMLHTREVCNISILFNLLFLCKNLFKTFLYCVRILLLFSCSVVSDPLWPHGLQAPLSMGFPKQEYWSGFPFPSPEDLPGSGTEPMSPALADGFFTTEPPGKPVWGLGEFKKARSVNTSVWALTTW